MKCTVAVVLGLFALSAGPVAQTVPVQTTPELDRAVAAAPAQMRQGATVIKWKPDFTYDTVKKGTNRLVCYDRSGEPGRQPFALQCTSIANLDRVAQNRRFEAIADQADRRAKLDAAEKDGTRVKPEYGSVFYNMNGPDQARARLHTTVSVPGATTQSTGLPDNARQGGAWIMDAARRALTS